MIIKVDLLPLQEVRSNKIMEVSMDKIIKFILFTLIIIPFGLYADINSTFPLDAINSIVSLEKKIDNQFSHHGTGFLLYSYHEKATAYVITNEHVLRNKDIYISIAADTMLVDYLNKIDCQQIYIEDCKWFLLDKILRHRYILKRDTTFYCNKDLDIAVMKIHFGSTCTINDSTLQLSNVKLIPKSHIKFRDDVKLGSNVFFVGFPYYIGTERGFFNLGLFSSQTLNPLVRKGAIAWLSNENDFFLLDAFSYSGNSGGPVFTANEIMSEFALIGIIKGHLPSNTSDNIGLAQCIWIDKVMELIKKFED